MNLLCISLNQYHCRSKWLAWCPRRSGRESNTHQLLHLAHVTITDTVLQCSHTCSLSHLVHDKEWKRYITRETWPRRTPLHGCRNDWSGLCWDFLQIKPRGVNTRLHRLTGSSMTGQFRWHQPASSSVISHMISRSKRAALGHKRGVLW